MTLPEMFERACKARPEVSRVGDDITLYYDPDRPPITGWYTRTKIGEIFRTHFLEASLAETLIIGACVKLLPGWSWCKIADGRHHAVEMIGMQREVVADTLPLALLSAVIATTPNEGAGHG